MHLLALCGCLIMLLGCGGEPGTTGDDASPMTKAGQMGATGTCSSIFPSYWQDPDPKFAAMWEGQTISGTPPADWKGPVFRLSDDYPTAPVDESASQPWRASRFDALFDSSTDPDVKSELAAEYSWAVMRYVQEGNLSGGDVEDDWNVCDNPVRGWYHIPFQTYDALSGREFSHGLTREAPVTFNVKDPDHPGASINLNTTMWAVAFFNPTAAYTLGTVWQADGTAKVPTSDIQFDEGAVVAKPLFNTSSPAQLPMLANMPAWQANISDPSFCACKPATGSTCTLAEESEQCARSTEIWGPVRLLQFDVAVKDSRAKGTEWVFGTFVADGERKADESNPWDRISPLGLMWGNDPPPAGQPAHNHPADPRQNGFAEEVIFWDAVDMLNSSGGDVIAKRPGHLGCNSRLNGPADNANSSCMSCHMTASVADKNLATPPIIAQFGGITSECVTPDPSNPSIGTDAAGSPAKVINGISFAEMDGIYFANTDAGTPVNMTVETASGPVNVLGDEPVYADGRGDWVSLDFSLQLSISLVQWGQWQQHVRDTAQAPTERVHEELPAR